MKLSGKIEVSMSNAEVVAAMQTYFSLIYGVPVVVESVDGVFAGVNIHNAPVQMVKPLGFPVEPETPPITTREPHFVGCTVKVAPAPVLSLLGPEAKALLG